MANQPTQSKQSDIKGKSTKKTKSSAHYQREYRKRLREQGLVKKEVWILPEHHPVLLSVEKALRKHYADATHHLASLQNEAKRLVKPTLPNQTELYQTPGGEQMKNASYVIENKNKHAVNMTGQHEALKNIKWTTETLYQTLQKAELFLDNHASIELIQGVHATMYLTMHDYGDLPIYITVSGEQILVESVLFSVNEVQDKRMFNELILRTHKYFPLSAISLDNLGDDGEYYQMFGSLSSTSSLQDVIIEIELLASNVIQATEAYSEFFLAEKAS